MPSRAILYLPLLTHRPEHYALRKARRVGIEAPPPGLDPHRCPFDPGSLVLQQLSDLSRVESPGDDDLKSAHSHD